MPFWPYLFFGTRWECPLFRFFSLIRKSRRVYITYQKMKEIGPIPRKLWPFESTPGHPRVTLGQQEIFRQSFIF